MALHKDAPTGDRHALPGRIYVDIAARDADTDFNTDSANLNKQVRVDSPASYYMLFSVGPALWVEMSSTAFDTLAEVLVGGNTTGGTDLLVSAGDELQIADTLTVGSFVSPPTDASIFMSDPTKAMLPNQGTEAQRDAITPSEGMIYHNLDINDLEFYNGTAWQSMAGGDVVGPAGSVDNRIARFNGTTGKIIKSSGVTLDDLNNLSGVNVLSLADLSITNYGDDDDLSIQHDGIDSVIENSEGDLLLVNTNVTGGVLVRLGTITDATQFHVADSASNALFSVRGDGSIQIVGPLVAPLTGTIDTVSGNTLLSGVGTAFLSELIPGQRIKVNSVEFIVASISNNEIMFVTVAPTFSGFGFNFFGETTSANGAIMELESTTRGFLMPRMTTVQRDAIAAPAAGLEIYNTTTNEPEFFNGIAWGFTEGQNLYANDGTLTGNRTVTGENNNFFQIDVFNTNAATFTTVAELDVTSNGIEWSISTGDGAGNLVDTSEIFIGLSSMTITDTINTKGLVYGADYSANFTTRSLVDKEYVDTHPAVPGGSDTQIQYNNAGVLAGATFITTDTLDLNFVDGGFINLGDDKDFTLSHTPAKSLIQNKTGDLVIENTDVTSDIIIELGSSTNTTKFDIQNSAFTSLMSVSGDGLVSVLSGSTLSLADNVSALWGTAALNIFHNGTDTTILNDTSGGIFNIWQAANADLLIRNSSIVDDVVIKLGTNTNATKFSVHDSSDTELLSVLGDGLIGIGTSTPDTILHLFQGSAGVVSAQTGTSLTLENSGSNYMSFLSPFGFEVGLYFGNDVSNDEGAIFYNSTTAPSGFMFRTNNIDNRVVIASDGNVGINITAPDSKLTIAEETPILLGDWSLQTTAAADDWIQIAFGAGVFVATANGGTGTRIMSSPDGITWTARTQPIAREWSSFVFGNNQFVSVASGADAMTSPDGITWTLQTTTGISNPAGLAFGAGLYVAVSQAGQVITSPDGITWTARTAAESNAWNAVAFANSIFVAVSTAGTNQVMTSSDGITWASQSAAATNDWRAVTFGNNTFVAVSRTGTGNRVMTSPDGITWTSRVSAGDNDWRDVEFGNGFFVVTASGGLDSMTSPDGINWSLKTTVSGSQFRSVAFGNNQFVTVGRQTTSGMILPFVGSSTAILDLQSTTSGFLPPRMTTVQRDGIPSPISGLEIFNTTTNEPEFFDGVSWGPTLTAAGTDTQVQFNSAGTLAGSDAFVFKGLNVGLSTTDPESKLHIVDVDPLTPGLRSWIAQAAPSAQWNGVTFGNDTFVAVSTSGGQRIMTSPDAVTWTLQDTPSDIFWVAITFGNSTFVAVTGNAVMSSADNGVTWIDRTPASTNGWTEITFGDGLFVAVSSSGVGDRVMTSPDGTTWTSQTSAEDNVWQGIAFGDSLFVAVSSDGTNQVMTSPDALTWTTQSASSVDTWAAIGFGDGLFVAVAFTGNVMTSPDGINWTDRTTSIGGGHNRVAVAFGNGFFAVTAQSFGYMSSPDGINWTTEPAPSGLFGSVTFGQNQFVAVSHSGATDAMTQETILPPPTVALKLDSTTSGFLPPRMTTVQRDAIFSPFGGLSFFNTDSTHLEIHDGTAFRKQSKVAVNEFEIFQESDFPNTPSGGVLTLDSGQYIIKDGYTTANGFAIADSATVIIRVDTVDPIVYVGVGTLFSGASIARLSIFGGLFVFGAPGAQMFDLTAETTQSIVTFLEAQIVALASGVTIGSFLGFRPFVFTNLFFTGVEEGFTFVDCIPTFDNVLINTNALGTLPVFDLSGTASRSTFKVVTVNPALAQPTFNIDPNIVGEPILVEINIEENEIFYAVGVAGTFTQVSDASFASEAVTSVTTSGGLAQFNYDGTPEVFVGQTVTLSGFSVGSYNVTDIITVTGAGFFEIGSIAFLSNDTGVFSSDSVVVSTTAHGLLAGDTLLMDTDFSTDYDGGAKIFDVFANTFRINRVFTITHTGTWDTGSLTQKDPRVTARFNTFQQDSEKIAAAFVNDNSTANGAIVNNTFTDIVFGTGGSALNPATTIERWKLVDELNGTFEYTGLEPFDGSITFDFTVLSSGGSQDFRFKWVKDSGSGFVNLEDDVEALVNVASNSQSITKTYPLVAVKGDQIKAQITRNSGTSGITTSYATIYATNN